MSATRARLFSLLIKFISKICTLLENDSKIMSQFSTKYLLFQVVTFNDKINGRNLKNAAKKQLLSVLTQYLKKKKSASVKEKLRT